MNKSILFACLIGIASLLTVQASDGPGAAEVNSVLGTGSTESTKLTDTADQE